MSHLQELDRESLIDRDVPLIDPAPDYDPDAADPRLKKLAGYALQARDSWMRSEARRVAPEKKRSWLRGNYQVIARLHPEVAGMEPEFMRLCAEGGDDEDR